MTLGVPIKFWFFHFQSLYYDELDDHKAKELEQMFREAYNQCQAFPLDPERGPALQIQRWTPCLNKNYDRTSDICFVLVQVVHVMPLVIDGNDKMDTVMHELTIVAWDAVRAPCCSECEATRLLLRRRNEDKICMVFNKYMAWSSIHCYEEGHIAMLLPVDIFATMLANSTKLVELMREEIDNGLDMRLGRTPEEALFSNSEFDKARCLVNQVFQLADYAFVNLCHETTQCCLKEVKLLATDDLREVKPRPTAQEASLL